MLFRSEITPRDHVAAWLAVNQRRIGSAPIEFERKDSPAKILTALFQTQRYLISFCTWDHASALEIQVLNASTGKSEFLSDGPCADHASLTQRLEAFMQWLESHNEPNVA